MMCPAIDNPASCEIRAVIRFLHAKNMNATGLHLYQSWLNIHPPITFKISLGYVTCSVQSCKHITSIPLWSVQRVHISHRWNETWKMCGSHDCKMNTTVFWDVMPCILVEVYHVLGEYTDSSSGLKSKPRKQQAECLVSGCLLDLLVDLEYISSTFFRNVGKNYTRLYWVTA
jgi:hypothetical protein